jgi:hypothetical protein
VGFKTEVLRKVRFETAFDKKQNRDLIDQVRLYAYAGKSIGFRGKAPKTPGSLIELKTRL